MRIQSQKNAKNQLANPADEQRSRSIIFQPLHFDIKQKSVVGVHSVIHCYLLEEKLFKSTETTETTRLLRHKLIHGTHRETRPCQSDHL